MRLVVIGGVAAGMSAAARARRLDASLEIIVLEKGDDVSYGACGLPYFVGGQVRDWRRLIVYTAERFQKERNVTVRTRSEVVSISHARRSVQLASGEQVRYDRLVIATGARQNASDLEGSKRPNVFALNTPPDAVRLKQHLDGRPAGRATVIGGGYIGLEAVESLRANGWRVTLLAGGKDLLGREDEELTQHLVRLLTQFRVDVELGRHVRNLEGLPGDLVVLATGLLPNVELAAEAGVELGRTGAIRTTERMETNLGGVYAAGDCAEAMHLVTGRATWVPLGTTANKMGRVAGANAAGRRERFSGIAGTGIVRVCGIGVAVTGLSVQQARQEGFDAVAARIEGVDRASYFGGRPVTVELIADRNTRRLLGGTLMGEYGIEGRVNVIATALQNRMKIDDFEQLDLAYSPPYAPVWDPVLVAAQQLIKKLG